MRSLICLIIVTMSSLIAPAGDYYGHQHYYGGGYTPSYSYSYYPAQIWGGKWYRAGWYAWVNGGWYLYGAGYEPGIILPVAPLNTTVIQLPAGLPNTTVISPPGAQMVKPAQRPSATTANPDGLTQQDIADLKAILKELRSQPPTAAPGK